MSTFSSMDISRTGVGMAHHWLENVSHNLANANTVRATDEEPFRAVRSVVEPRENGPFTAGGSGVATTGQVREEGDPPLTYDPNHPQADEDGMVAMPVMDTAGQMVDMMLAQRHYQMNARNIETAKEAYESALRIGGRG